MHQVWKHPPKGIIKFNVDISYNSNSSFACVAVVGRDFLGKILFGKAQKIQVSSPLKAKAEALLIGINFVIENNLTNCIFEIDSLEVYNVVSKIYQSY